MRAHRLLGLSALLLLLVGALAVPGPARAINPPGCLFVGQECASCGRDCGKLCNDYQCDDGSSYQTCGSCDCIDQCVVS
jgi:hypothetical protein